MKTHQDQQLTKHFSLREMTISGTAIRYGWDNTPMNFEIENLRQLCINVLEPLRMRFGVIRITSGFRCKAVNDAVGGARDSQHMFGQAADIFVQNMEVGKKMYDFIRQNIPFDQMILEVDKDRGRYWIHISYVSEKPNRRHAWMNYIMHHNIRKKTSA